MAFRAYVRSAAVHFGVNGWVKNLQGGDVEFIAQAEDDAISSFIRAVYLGSPLSTVRSIDFTEEPRVLNLDNFEIIFS